MHMNRDQRRYPQSTWAVMALESIHLLDLACWAARR